MTLVHKRQAVRKYTYRFTFHILGNHIVSALQRCVDLARTEERQTATGGHTGQQQFTAACCFHQIHHVSSDIVVHTYMCEVCAQCLKFTGFYYRLQLFQQLTAIRPAQYFPETPVSA